MRTAHTRSPQANTDKMSCFCHLKEDDFGGLNMFSSNSTKKERKTIFPHQKGETRNCFFSWTGHQRLTWTAFPMFAMFATCMYNPWCFMFDGNRLFAFNLFRQFLSLQLFPTQLHTLHLYIWSLLDLFFSFSPKVIRNCKVLRVADGVLFPLSYEIE